MVITSKWRTMSHVVLILLVLNLEYSGGTRSIPWLLMPWLLPSPGHQRPWNSPCRINVPLVSTREHKIDRNANIPSNLKNKSHQIPTIKRFLSRLAVVSGQSIEARCLVENEDVVGAALTGDAPTTSEWSTSLLSTKVRLILKVWR